MLEAGRGSYVLHVKDYSLIHVVQLIATSIVFKYFPQKGASRNDVLMTFVLHLGICFTSVFAIPN